MRKRILNTDLFGNSIAIIDNELLLGIVVDHYFKYGLNDPEHDIIDVLMAETDEDIVEAIDTSIDFPDHLSVIIAIEESIDANRNGYDYYKNNAVYLGLQDNYFEFEFKYGEPNE